MLIENTGYNKPVFIIVAGFLLTVVAGLSVHVVMLQVFDVPYPSSLPTAGWARLPDRLLSTFGAIMLYGMLPPGTGARSNVRRGVLVFVLLGMIHETLFRVPIMNIVTASRWTLYPFVDAVPSYITLAAIATLVTLGSPQFTSPFRRAIGAIIIGVPVYMILAPVVTNLFSGIAAWTDKREGYGFYNPPYDWHVEVPAYITFIEPVFAAFAIAAIVWRRLPGSPFPAGFWLATLLFALRGQLFSCFTNLAYTRTDAMTAMLSFGQFTFESLAVAVLTAATWSLAGPTRSAFSQLRELG